MFLKYIYSPVQTEVLSLTQGFLDAFHNWPSDEMTVILKAYGWSPGSTQVNENILDITRVKSLTWASVKRRASYGQTTVSGFHMPECPKATVSHALLNSTGLSSGTMVLNVLSCTQYILSLQNKKGFW